ncbi:unnamed protein product [Rotaria socialis]|uniref:ABC transporter domain-containing protein n=1 Tax=Rotaria socialis TaxID=392032 RepID=A0A820CTJ0_9BILA|nr:unnamed protein product [Rotaria socialis]CAF4219210.1 unnamed protein product [Rotaria socialis]
MQKCCSVCQIPYLETAQKQILTVLSGIFQTGMNAIMRLTGSGKPSLLDLLADRKDREVGYVVQDDILTSDCRQICTSEKNKIVDEVIAQLGLEKCADTIVGTEFRRGVSGGERKRTNIGMELVLSSRVLFLDEPTTGLDSTMARSVMECLHQLSHNGRDRLSPSTDNENNQIECHFNEEYMKTDIYKSIQNQISKKNFVSSGNNNVRL